MEISFHGLFGIWTAGKNGESTVELFGKHDTGEFVRIGHGAERELLRHAFPQIVWKAVGVATDEDDFARAAVALFAKPLCERFGITLLAIRVKQKRSCGAIGVDVFDCGFAITHLVYFDRTGMRDALYIIVEDGANFRAAGFAEHE